MFPYCGESTFLLCCPVKVPQILEGGLAPVGLVATSASPVVAHTPSMVCEDFLVM